MNIDTLLFGATVQDQQGNVRRNFGLCNMVVWGLIIALIYTYSGGKDGKKQKGGGFANGLFWGFVALLAAVILSGASCLATENEYCGIFDLF